MTRLKENKPDGTAREKARLSRSEIMRRVKSKNTKPEISVRRFLRASGIRFRSQAKLPGTPDFALIDAKIAVRVMGCFWHGHSCKNGDRMPKTNIHYWTTKIARNIARDKENRRDLIKLGWQVIDIWECQLRTEKWKRGLTRRTLNNI